jgi:ureidoglycolate hydrolase
MSAAQRNKESTIQPDPMSLKAVEKHDHFIELVLADAENTQDVGWFINDASDIPENARINIPFYSHVTEGAIIENAEWDDPVVRLAKIRWSGNHQIKWLERHMRTTQAFLLIGQNPGMLVLGEATHNREDLTEEERRYPDNNRIKGYIIPPGCGIIIKKGVWHDFPVSVGPEVTVLTINTREVVNALMSMKEPAPMDFGDCYKVRTLDRHPDINLCFPDPRSFVESLQLG